MAIFETPVPITLEVELGIGDIHIEASERSDTNVEVLPARAGKRDDEAAVEQTRVEFTSGRLYIKGPKPRRVLFGNGGSVEVRIELPAGSRVQAETGYGAVRAVGELGECRVSTGAGDVTLDRATTLNVNTGSGAIRIGATSGATVIKNANGDTWVGEATGDLRVSSSNGKITLDRTSAGVVAKTSYGDVRIGEVERGEVNAQTAYGSLEFGVALGTPAYLDLTTAYGTMSSELTGGGAPDSGGPTVKLRGRTAYGDIRVLRA